MTKRYPCGLTASGGLFPLPDVCPMHGENCCRPDAAPDLLAALRQCASFMDSSCDNEELLTVVRKAISKAEGHAGEEGR
jgi:hypothetical protein